MILPLIVVTLWNRMDYLSNWFDHVRRLEAPTGYTILPVVVDNGSNDTTVQVIRRALDDGLMCHQNLHTMPNYVGFASALNYAIKQTVVHHDCKFVAVADDETALRRDWLANLAEQADADLVANPDRKIGMWSGPVFHDGLKLATAGHVVRGNDGACLDVDRGMEESVSRWNDFKPFCACFAACLLQTKMLAEVGLPDSEQFIYYDDIDLGFKARLRGWETRYVRSAVAYHSLPKPDKKYSKHLIAGRIALALKYAPDAERERILSELNSQELVVYRDIVACRYEIDPYGTDALRKKVWAEAINVKGVLT